MTTGIYAYGVIGGEAASAPDVAGVDPLRPLRVVQRGSLAAVVGDVEVDQFEGEHLKRNVAEPEWLETKVRAHERVLDALVAQGAVVPMRFGSIFSRQDALEQMLDGSSEALAAALDRVEGKNEWGVKVYWDSSRLAATLAGPATGSSGRDYLARKRAELHATEEAVARASEVAQRMHDTLGARAAEATLMQVRSTTARPVALNAAYLVALDQRDRFMQTVAELQDDNAGAFMLEVTGPWPPYNFTSVDVSGAVS